MSASHSRTIETKTPKHAWTDNRRLNPDHEGENKKAFDVGTAFHTMLTSVGESIAVLPYDSYRSKDAQAERDDA